VTVGLNPLEHPRLSGCNWAKSAVSRMYVRAQFHPDAHASVPALSPECRWFHPEHIVGEPVIVVSR